MILDPDALLPPGPARWSPEAVGEAWAQCWRALRAALLDPAVLTVACTVGAPGSGKSAWAQENDQPGLVIFDACWTDPGRRRGLAQRIRQAGKVAVAVVIMTPVDQCRDRNDLRPPERRVPDLAIVRAATLIRHQPPTLAEGWSRVLVQDGQAERIHDGLTPEEALARLGRAPANQAWAHVRAQVLPAYRAAAARERRPDVPPPSVDLALERLGPALARGSAGDDRVGWRLGQIGGRVERQGRGAWEQQVQAAGVPGFRATQQDELVSDWAEHVGQEIAQVRERLPAGIAASVREAWALGLSAAELERRWKAEGLPLDQGGTAEGQGRVLAHRAHAGLVQEVTRAHQEAAETDWYTWEHSGNPNPDPQHLAAHGKRFRWARRPAFGHPGDRPNCGCRAVPLLRAVDLRRLRAKSA